MIIYNQPIKEEMGVCKAKPRMREINPSETAAAYQLAKRKEIRTKMISRTQINRTIRVRLYRPEGERDFFRIIASAIFPAERISVDTNTPSEHFCSVTR